MTKKSIGIVGARGYVGRELIALLADHPRFRLEYVGSRQEAGRPVSGIAPSAPAGLVFEALDMDAVAGREVDVCVLALPNGHAAQWVEAIHGAQPDTTVIDVSADHRFADDWYYGLPELTRTGYQGQKRIANPGCYATGMQLAIAPLREELSAPPVCFGVSGYSGAGTRPTPRNDPKLLADNLMPYTLVGHLHEREVTYRLKYAVHFMPHVAAFFRGILLTIDLRFDEPLGAHDAMLRYRQFYRDEPLVDVVEGTPQVRDTAGRHVAVIGGFSADPHGNRLVLVATLDNLLKGAATQVLQNANLACGFDELEGLHDALRLAEG